MFLINHIHKYLNIKIRKIILAGDSAGSNLALSLTAMIIKNK
jgi:acetyl esterase/lipase